MNDLFLINEEERNRILGMHETATKKHYLSEQPTPDFGQQPIGPKTLPDTLKSVVKKGLEGDPYVYGKLGNDYYYAKASDGDYPNWILATNPNAINSIKGKIYNEKVPAVTTVKAPVKGKTKVQTKKTTTTPKTTTKSKTTTTTVPGKEKFKVTPKTNVRGKDKFKLEPELYTVAKDNTRVGNGRKEKLPNIKDVLNDIGPSKKSTLPLHIRAVWDYLMGRTEPFTSADLTREEQKYVKQVAMNNPNKGFTYGIWKASGASNLPTAMTTGSSSEKKRLNQSGGSGSLINSPLAGQFMYFLGEVSPSNVKISPDKKKVTVKDNYDMNNSKIPKDKMIKDFAKQVGKFALGDATLYSVIRQTVGLKELAGYKGYPVNLDV
jgi:hypothetical protein